MNLEDERQFSEMQELEEQLKLAQKLEAIGQLAAGLAHEINTPCQFVFDNLTFLSAAIDDLTAPLIAYVDLLELVKNSGTNEVDLQHFQKLADDADIEFLLEEVPTALSQSREGITRIRKIIQAMKVFSHPGDSMKPTDLNLAIESTTVVARHEWKKVAEVELNLDASIPDVICNRSAINQVFLDLIINAAHAIGDALGKEKTGKGKITINSGADKDDAVITISDTGSGIPQDIFNRIFDPFFTTKEVGKGIGQGLAVAYTVVTKHHGGEISVNSEPGTGTTFVVRLPLCGRVVQKPG